MKMIRSRFYALGIASGMLRFRDTRDTEHSRARNTRLGILGNLPTCRPADTERRGEQDGYVGTLARWHVGTLARWHVARPTLPARGVGGKPLDPAARINSLRGRRLD